MTPDDQITAQARVAGSARGPRQLARRALWRLAPGYARRRGLPAAVERLQADLDHVSKRHGEQIERLEELARELVSTAESLRREIARQAPRDAD
jgi:glucose-6-phosphate-specific signal transduction histidine kinase